ncbi:conserved hypothetical protein [Candidatus Terasakiella magnetica]|nr:conserved hypothetical protein [Candidatus Terasakiella magnetica]
MTEPPAPPLPIAGPLTTESVIVRTPHPLSADVDDETVLMSIEQGNYYGLGSTARDIWSRLERPIRIGDLCAGLAAEYDVPPALIEADTLAFIRRLAEEKLIRTLG